MKQKRRFLEDISILNLTFKPSFLLQIAQFRYIKIQLETKDITTRLREIKLKIYMVYSPKPRSDIFCFKLNFKLSKLVLGKFSS